MIAYNFATKNLYGYVIKSMDDHLPFKDFFFPQKVNIRCNSPNQ
jgi:hypothetical protein